MGADAFEEVEVFGGEFEAADAVGDGDQPQKPAGGDKRNTYAAAPFVKMVRIEVFETNDPRFFGSVKVDRVAGDLGFGNAADFGAFGLKDFLGGVFGE